MKHNTYTREVLNKHPHMFRRLHIETGIDFEKEFTIKKITGNYTVNQVKKILASDGITTDNSEVVLLTAPSEYWSLQTVYFATYGDIRLTPYRYLSRTLERKWKPIGMGIKTPTKTDFNEVRKDETAVCYIIAQERELLSPYKSERFVRDLEPWERTIETKTEIILYGTNIRVEGSSWDLDKSGYNRVNAEDRLSDIIATRKSDRNKAEYLKHDFTPKAEALCGMINALKVDFATAITNTQSSWTIRDIGKLMASELNDTMWYVNHYAENTSKKSYCSVESSESDYRTALNKITELTEKLNKMVA